MATSFPPSLPLVRHWQLQNQALARMFYAVASSPLLSFTNAGELRL